MKIVWELTEKSAKFLILVDEFTLATRGPSLYVKIWRLYTSGSFEDGPRTERINIFLMVVDP